MSNDLMNGSKKRNEKDHIGSDAPLSDPKRSRRRKGGRAIRLAWLGSLMGLLALASLPAQAALITINETIDLSRYIKNNYLYVPITPKTIAVGDSVDLTVNFSAGQAARMSDNGATWEWFEPWSGEAIYPWLGGGNENNFTIENILVTFLGFSQIGGVSGTLALASQMSGMVHLGPWFGNFLSAGQSIQFTGYNVTYDVTRLTTGPNTYSNIWFRLDSPEFAVVSVAVPEPGALSLLVIGLAGLAVAQRKKIGPWRGAYPA